MSETPMQDGPNTHRYRTYSRGTTFHVVQTTDVDGVTHTFQVPAELVAALATPPVPAGDIAPAYPISCQAAAAGPACEQDVHAWFELSYSSYLVLPRSLMQEMPAAWQHAMVALLERMREEFPGEHSSYTVLKKGERNRFERDPLRRYRYPDADAIERARATDEVKG